jgi:hypothetical protein
MASRKGYGAGSDTASNDTPLSGSGLAAYDAYDRPAPPPSNPNHVRVKVSLSKQGAYRME